MAERLRVSAELLTHVVRIITGISRVRKPNRREDIVVLLPFLPHKAEI